MPRKQRFKPSRKPQAAQTQPASSKVDDRHEIHPDDADIETRDEDHARMEDPGSDATD